MLFQVLRGENWLPIRPGFHSLEYYRKKVKKEDRFELNGLITEYVLFKTQLYTFINIFCYGSPTGSLRIDSCDPSLCLYIILY